jgi:hypothetical protein
VPSDELEELDSLDEVEEEYPLEHPPESDVLDPSAFAE